MKSGWYLRTECAGIFGVSVSYLDRDVRPLLRDEEQRKEKRRVYWYAPAVHQAILSRRLGSRTVRDSDSGREDLALKKLQQEVRKLQSQNANLRLTVRERSGRLIDRSEARATLDSLRDRLRGFGKTLRKQKAGAKLLRLWNEFLAGVKDDIESGGL